MRVIAVTRGHCFGNAFGLHQICFAGKIIMPARPEAAGKASVHVNRQYIRIGFAQPFWRRRGWCAQHHAKSSATDHINRAVHPVPAKTAFAYFDTAPRKFANPDICKTQPAHPLRIACPIFLWPMFGVITDT